MENGKELANWSVRGLNCVQFPILPSSHNLRSFKEQLLNIQLALGKQGPGLVHFYAPHRSSIAATSCSTNVPLIELI